MSDVHGKEITRTEAEPIAEIDRLDVEADDRAAMRRGAGLLVGRPVDAIALRILRDRWGSAAGPWTASELDAETLGPMEQGEIAVTGAHVLPGYLDGIGDEHVVAGVAAVADPSSEHDARRLHPVGGGA